MKKKRFPLFRILGLVVLAGAGAGIAVLASREEGRQQLARFGETVGEKASEYLNVGVHYASQWAEESRNRKDDYAKFPVYSSLQNGARQNDLTPTR